MEVFAGANKVFACRKRSISMSMRLRISVNAMEASIDREAASGSTFPTKINRSVTLE